jgi:deoxycytidylate deaminase
MGEYTYLPLGAGRCVKQHVTATVVTERGDRFTSTNFCMTPQEVCPRADLPTGVGYELCKSVCNQVAHAEANAIRYAGLAAIGATLEVSGHTYACGSCKNAALHGGIKEIIIK